MSNITKTTSAVSSKTISIGGVTVGNVPNPGAARVQTKVESGTLAVGGVSKVATLPKQTFQPAPPSPKVDNTANQWLRDAMSKGQESQLFHQPGNVKYNLPPHEWSIPLNQSLLNVNSGTVKETDHRTRRAIMWCHGYTTVGDSSYQWSSDARNPVAGKSTAPTDTAWGFQFLWNPDTISNTLSRNVNFTPSPADKTAQLFGLFTAMEAVSFKIVIDRVNDFAALKGLAIKGLEDLRNTNGAAAAIQQYYRYRYPSVAVEDLYKQVQDLMLLGTMADIEYIYKMINGSGVGNAEWSNVLGRKTADIGFLAPTVIGVQFGPNKDSLSYVGYIDGLNIVHNIFTEDMIPLHSEITVSFVAYARTALTQKA